MQIEELNRFTKLFDTYGNLLSSKQYEVMFNMLNNDLSESEFAELQSGSRQAVHDASFKAKKQLLEYEEKCGIVAQHEKLKIELKKLQNFAKSIENQEIICKIDEILKNL